MNFSASKRSKLFLNLILGLSLGLGLSSKSVASETIYINYGLLEFSISVEALDNYARQGIVNSQLADLEKYLGKEQFARFREVLLTRLDLTPIAISQFLYSPQGESILQKLGQLVKTKNEYTSLYGLRSAIVLSAADRDGLTLLNIFKKFPLPTLKIDSVKGWQLMENVSDLVKTTSQAVNTIQSQADREIATAGSSDFTKVPDLRQPGIFGYFKESFELKDLKRDRVFPVDLYLPDTQETTPLPLVIISHGLGGDRLTFAYLASHLASYGFAVAVPEHPGSNGERLMSLLNGLAKEVSSPQELIDRPQDITYLLNYLQVNYSKKINVEGVGIIGQSFGAYTALAVSGAQLNFALLKENCQSSKSGLNLSLLIQCLGNKLSEGKENWRDERISATIAINPLTSSIFGREQLSKLQLPLMILTGSADTVTPAYIEQIQPFTWLTNPEKYLVLLEHATHFSTLAKSKDKESIPIPERAIGPDPEIAQTYLKALSVTFMQTYIAKQNDYRIYLNAAYAKNLSQKIMPLSLIRSLEKDKL